MSDAAADAILELPAQRADGLTICPSEAARRLDPDDRRTHMGRVHEAARALVASGTGVLTQGGSVVPPDDVVGAYRIRRAWVTSRGRGVPAIRWATTRRANRCR